MTDTGNTAVAKRQEAPIMVLRSRLEERASEIKAALPGIPPERFIRAVITAAQINPDILACTWQSVWLACMRACRDGLIPDGVEGALVPYKDKATWIPMYRGLLRKFQESGQFKWITANVVYPNEEFAHYIDEHGEHLRHTPGDDISQPIVRAYALATTKDGGVFVSVLPKAEIEKARRHSRASREDAPWNMWYSEMAKKTALRRLSKMLPTAPLFEDDEDQFIEDDARPQLAAVNPNRERGAAAALDAFAGSPEGMVHPDSGPSDARADESGGGDTHDGASAARTAPAESTAAADASTGPVTEDPLAVAHRRGVDSKAKGHQRKALPPEYRVPERDAEAQSWLQGWDGK